MNAHMHPSLTFPHHFRPLATIGETLRIWHRRFEERQALMRLSDRDLHDVGLTPAEAQWEASLPFWRQTQLH